MPNRIIKESICYSEDINKLSWTEEVFFYRLIVNCDDYGRLDARPAILKAKLFPLKDITVKQVESFLNKLVTVGMVRVYEYDRQPFLQLLAWEKHQQIRAKKSKYPTPDIICNQVQSDVPVIQSESESESESESDAGASAHTNKIFEIIDYLNSKTNSKYDKKVTKNQEHISGRLNDGKTLDDCKYVIDVKCEEWLNTDFEKNLNPVTLFKPSNFDRYINQKRKETVVYEPEKEGLQQWQF